MRRSPLILRFILAPPALTVESAPASQFQLRLVGDSNRVYRIEATEDFLS